MGKRVLALFLAAIVSITMAPAELSAAKLSQERFQEESLENWTSPVGGFQEESLENWMPPVGGFQEQEMIEISEKEAESLGISVEESAGLERGTANSVVRGSQKYDSSWDIYSTNYIYNCLAKEEKQFWDALDHLCRICLTENKDARHYAVKDKNDNLYWCYIMEPGVSYSSRGLSGDRVAELLVLFVYANPQYYFLDGYLEGGGAIFPIVYEEFGKGSGRKAATARMKKVIDRMEKQIANGKTGIEKAKIAHDLVIKSVKYDYLFCTPLEKSPYHQSAYSVFCDGYTVCAGYAKAYELLMNGAGVDALAVGGNGHAWNMVCLDGFWYHVDCTWDDRDGTGGKEGVYLYFNRSTFMMEQLDGSGAHKVSPLYKNYIPASTRDSGAAEDSIGTYQEPVTRSEKPKIIQKKVSGGIRITLKTADSGAKIYYTLDGTRPSGAFTRCFLYKRPFKVSANVTVKAVAVCDAKWDSGISASKVYGKIYKVTFHTMGGTNIPPQKVYANSKVKKPLSPKYPGYKFAGWYKDKKCKKPWDFKKKVTRNMTLYAKWKKQ